MVKSNRVQVLTMLPTVIGADLSVSPNGDKSVAVIRRGPVCYPPVEVPTGNAVATAQALVNLFHDREADALFVDATGLGAPIFHMLQEADIDPVIGVNFSATPPDPQFLNMRSYLWFQVKEWLEAGGILPDDQRLLAELTTPKWKMNAKQLIQVEAKDQIRKRLPGRGSTDRADALATTFAMKVAKRNSRQRSYQTESEYDPYADI